MRLRRLELFGFRSYERFLYEPGPSLNAIEGPNGIGKTNLVEAIYLLSLARSWRTGKSAPLVNEGSPFARVRAEILEGRLLRTVEVILTKDERRVLVDGKPLKRLSELPRLVNVLLFTPSDCALFRGAPAERRSFLDLTISRRDEAYLNAILRYGKLLEQKNALLKGERPDPTLLETLTDQMAAECATIIAGRKRFVAETNEILTRLTKSLYGEDRRAELAYRPFVDGQNLLESAKTALHRQIPSDLLHHLTSSGTHREDFSFLLDGKDVGVYGSQGQNRLAAIALKISPAFLKQEAGKEPIAVLDDVMSELDEESASRLLGILRGLGQSFITSTKISVAGAMRLKLPVHNPA